MTAANERAKRNKARRLSPAERLAVGVNCDGKPWGVPRMHINRWGEPKPCLTRENAVAVALAYTLDTERTRNGPVEPYQCDFCGWWHIGTRRASVRKPVEQIEVGDRVWWNLKAENRGPAERRVSVVARRCHRQGREAIDPGNKAARERRMRRLEGAA